MTETRSIFIWELKWMTILVFGAAMLAAETLGAQTKKQDVPIDPANFAEGSAEFAALSAAAKYVADEEFTLRQDYWQGDLSSIAGKALRIQFFPHMTYRLFFATGADDLPKGAKLRVKIVDHTMTEVASAATRFKSTAAVLKFEPKKTGLYMVLLRVEAPEEVKTDLRIPCVLFYGYE